MGLFNFFKKKKSISTREASKHAEIRYQHVIEKNSHSADAPVNSISESVKSEIIKNMVESATFEVKFNDNPEDYEKRYTDDIDLPEGYKLREMLLLVWWGRVKKGRTLDDNIPLYFFRSYDINAEKVTLKFVNDRLLFVDDKGKVRYTERGAELATKYQAVWDIHSTRSFTETNLDLQWPNWDKTKFLIKDKQDFIRVSDAQFKDQQKLLKEAWIGDNSEIAKETRRELRADAEEHKQFIASVKQDIQDLKDKLAARDE